EPREQRRDAGGVVGDVHPPPAIGGGGGGGGAFLVVDVDVEVDVEHGLGHVDADEHAGRGDGGGDGRGGGGGGGVVGIGPLHGGFPALPMRTATRGRGRGDVRAAVRVECTRPP